MVYKSIGFGGGDVREPCRIIPARASGSLIAKVGSAKNGRPCSAGREEHVERLLELDNEILGYNLDGRMCLMRARKNDRKFDCFLSMPFTKGVTERKTGRTMLILGSSSHHGEAMQGQFEGVMWTPETEEENKRYGDTIRWINVGKLKEGFVGLDYNPRAPAHAGVATSIEDIKFLANALIEFGYNPQKKLFLLKPPYIVESEDGKSLRSQGYKTIEDFTKYSGGKTQ